MKRVSVPPGPLSRNRPRSAAAAAAAACARARARVCVVSGPHVFAHRAPSSLARAPTHGPQISRRRHSQLALPTINSNRYTAPARLPTTTECPDLLITQRAGWLKVRRRVGHTVRSAPSTVCDAGSSSSSGGTPAAAAAAAAAAAVAGRGLRTKPAACQVSVAFKCLPLLELTYSRMYHGDRQETRAK